MATTKTTAIAVRHSLSMLDCFAIRLSFISSEDSSDDSSESPQVPPDGESAGKLVLGGGVGGGGGTGWKLGAKVEEGRELVWGWLRGIVGVEAGGLWLFAFWVFVVFWFDPPRTDCRRNSFRRLTTARVT